MKTNIKKRILHGSIWAIVARVTGIMTGLAVNATLARLLSPEDMGAYFLTLSIVSLATLIAQTGLPTTLVRVIAESLGKKDNGRAWMAIKLSFTLCSLFSFIIAIIFYLRVGEWLATTIFESTSMGKIIGIASLLIFVITLHSLSVEIFRGFHDIRLASIFGNVTTSLFSAIAFGIIWLLEGHVELQEILQLSLGVWVMSFLMTVLFFPSRFSSLNRGGSMGSKELLKMSLPLGIIAVTFFVANQGDLWVVGVFLSEQQTALYGAVLRLMIIMTMAHSLAISVIQSTIAEMFGSGDTMRIQRIVQSAAFISCVPAILLLLILACFGGELLTVLFGDFYKNGYWPLIILCTGQLISMLMGPAGMVLIMSGHQTSLMTLILVTAGVGFILATYLAPILGLIGIAFAWSTGSILQGIGAWLLVKKKLNINCHACPVLIKDLKEVMLC